MRKTDRLLIVTMALLIGFAAGYLPSRRELNECRRERAVLTADLARAVAHGVVIEAELNLCKDGVQ